MPFDVNKSTDDDFGCVVEILLDADDDVDVLDSVVTAVEVLLEVDSVVEEVVEEFWKIAIASRGKFRCSPPASNRFVRETLLFLAWIVHLSCE